MQKLINIQNKRVVWIILAVAGFLLLAISYFFFQQYLHMRPCEKCVSIRFSVFLLSLGSLIIAFLPKNIFVKLIGFASIFWGIIFGVQNSIVLTEIYAHKENSAHLCSVGQNYVPDFLQQNSVTPDLFKTQAECGDDAPKVDKNTKLSALQKFFIGDENQKGLYKDGWYLFPSYKLVNMAQICLTYFVLCLIILAFMLVGFTAEHLKKLKKS